MLEIKPHRLQKFRLSLSLKIMDLHYFEEFPEMGNLITRNYLLKARGTKNVLNYLNYRWQENYMLF